MQVHVHLGSGRPELKDELYILEELNGCTFYSVQLTTKK